jgi:GNAT superfamily N-acetyltransferase
LDIVIRPVSYAEILSAPNAQELFSEYESECALPELSPICPQADLYEAMEKGGGMQAFGVYEGEKLIGFMTVLVWIVPHYGKRIASTADFFLADAFRIKGIWPKMMATIKEYAKSKGCVSLQCTAPVGSRFDLLMGLNKNRCRKTNHVYLWKIE